MTLSACRYEECSSADTIVWSQLVSLRTVFGLRLEARGPGYTGVHRATAGATLTMAITCVLCSMMLRVVSERIGGVIRKCLDDRWLARLRFQELS